MKINSLIYLFSALITFIFPSNLGFYTLLVSSSFLILLFFNTLTFNYFNFTYISLPILLINSAFGLSNFDSYFNFFNKGIFSYMSIYHFFGFSSFIGISFYALKFLIRSNAKVIKFEYFFLIILFFLSIISVFFAFNFENERLFQSIFWIQNIFISIWIYILTKDLYADELDKIIKHIVNLIIVILILSNLFIVSHFKFFLIPFALCLFLYSIINLNKNFLKNFFVSILCLVYLINIIDYLSLTLILIIITSSIFLTFFIFSNFITKISLKIFFYIFKTLIFIFLFFILFPDFLLNIDLFGKYYSIRSIENTVELGELIKFKFLSDRFVIWSSAIQEINSFGGFFSNLIRPSGSTFIPLEFGIFYNSERAYQEWMGGSHNTYIDLAINYGYLGLCFYTYFIILMTNKLESILILKNNNFNYLGVLLIALISSFHLPSFLNSYILEAMSFIYWFLFGLIYSMFKSQ